MDSKKTILCPKCGRKVGTWDGKAKVTINYICHKCNKSVVFDGETQKIELKPIPERVTASGAIFY